MDRLILNEVSLSFKEHMYLDNSVEFDLVFDFKGLGIHAFDRRKKAHMNIHM